MKEIFLLKLGEIVLKGANKRQFEDKLRQNVRRRMRPYGNFDVYLMQSTVYVEPMDEEADVDGAWGYINGEEYGVAPMQVNLPYGSYNVQVAKDGYDTFRQSVNIQSSTASLHATLN